MQFREYLGEFRSNKPQGQMFGKEQLIEWVKSAKLLKFVIFIRANNITEKDIVIYEYDEFGVNDKFIILTDRKNKSDIVGYAWLNNKIKSEYWQVRDVAIFPEYRNKGICTNLYVKLIKEGYNLMNGFSLSSEIEKLWKKLPEFVNVYTWDKQNDKLSIMDERPKEDNKWDDEQQFFWIGVAHPNELKESQWHAEDNHWFNEWINGRFSPSFGSEWIEGIY